MRLITCLYLLAFAAGASAQDEELLTPAPNEAAGDAAQAIDFPEGALLQDRDDEPANAERLIDEQELHMRRLRALQRRAELQSAQRDVEKAVAETEQAKSDAEKARNAGRPPAPKVVYESNGGPAPATFGPAPSLVGITNDAAILDYSGAVHTVAINQRVNGWRVRELGFDYVVLEDPAGGTRRQELGW